MYHYRCVFTLHNTQHIHLLCHVVSRHQVTAHDNDTSYVASRTIGHSFFQVYALSDAQAGCQHMMGLWDSLKDSVSRCTGNDYARALACVVDSVISMCMRIQSCSCARMSCVHPAVSVVRSWRLRAKMIFLDNKCYSILASLRMSGSQALSETCTASLRPLQEPCVLPPRPVHLQHQALIAAC